MGILKVKELGVFYTGTLSVGRMVVPAHPVLLNATDPALC